MRNQFADTLRDIRTGYQDAVKLIRFALIYQVFWPAFHGYLTVYVDRMNERTGFR